MQPTFRRAHNVLVLFSSLRASFYLTMLASSKNTPAKNVDEADASNSPPSQVRASDSGGAFSAKVAKLYLLTQGSLPLPKVPPLGVPPPFPSASLPHPLSQSTVSRQPFIHEQLLGCPGWAPWRGGRALASWAQRYGFGSERRHFFFQVLKT